MEFYENKDLYGNRDLVQVMADLLKELMSLYVIGCCVLSLYFICW
jgi:hypothetical protein